MSPMLQREIRLLSISSRPQSDSARAGRGILLCLQRLCARHGLGDRIRCSYVMAREGVDVAGLVEGADVLLVGSSVTQAGPSSASRAFWEQVGTAELGGVHASSWITCGGTHTGGELAHQSNLSALRVSAGEVQPSSRSRLSLTRIAHCVCGQALGACVFSLYQHSCIFTMHERDAADVAVGDFTLLDVWFMEQFAKVSILVALASNDRKKYVELQKLVGIQPRYW